MEYIKFLIDNYQQIFDQALVALGAFAGLMTALYALFLLIPGEQPDKVIKMIMDFTTKYSKK